MSARGLIGRGVLAALASGMLLGVVAPASAAPAPRAVGTTITGMGVLTIRTYEGGLTPHRITASLSNNQIMCDLEFRLFGVGRNGGHWQSNSLYPGCAYGTVFATWVREFEFQDDTNLCVQVGKRGEGWQPRNACLHMSA